jgi:hypothetical protein
METDLDVNQFLTTIYRYIQLGVHIKAYYSKKYGKFHRELDEVCEFYVDDNNVPQGRVLYQKIYGSNPTMCKPSKHLQEYLENQNIDISDILNKLPDEMPIRTQEEGFESDEVKTESTVASPDDALNKEAPVDANAVEVKDAPKEEKPAEPSTTVVTPPQVSPAPPLTPQQVTPTAVPTAQPQAAQQPSAQPTPPPVTPVQPQAQPQVQAQMQPQVQPVAKLTNE